MDNGALIQLRGVEKDYFLGEVVVSVLHGITLDIRQGEFVSIMGVSGSGKSTLMNILGCLDRPTRGKYILNSQDVSSLSRNELARVRNKTIGFVFQNFNLLTGLTAVENVALPLLYMGIPEKNRIERAKQLLAKFGLEDRIGHFPTQLSGGQQQRVAAARALANEPKIVLADEPTGNLDSQASHDVMQMFKNLHKEEGVTIILVTHDPEVARNAQRIIYIKDGLIQNDEEAG